MDWKGGRRSTNVQDRRGKGVKAGGGIGLVGLIVILIGWAMGVDPRTMLGLVEGSQQITGSTQTTQTASNDEQSEFVRVMLGSNEDLWQKQFQQYGQRFSVPQLILFSGQTQSACGLASSATGPFYCPADQKIYIDLDFIRQMQQLGASNNQQVAGNFAMGYVIAHEFGHHISNELGILPKVHQAMQAARSQSEANAYSVKLELQADCFAGVWAANLGNYNINITQQDIENGLRAARAVGDDHIMQSSGRSVNPENFTHGSSEQRMKWFTTGLNAGDMNVCDTF